MENMREGLTKIEDKVRRSDRVLQRMNRREEMQKLLN